jgi:hypothetical protein
MAECIITNLKFREKCQQKSEQRVEKKKEEEKTAAKAVTPSSVCMRKHEIKWKKWLEALNSS